VRAWKAAAAAAAAHSNSHRHTKLGQAAAEYRSSSHQCGERQPRPLEAEIWPAPAVLAPMWILIKNIMPPTS
jgi:hypothetical protein